MASTKVDNGEIDAYTKPDITCPGIIAKSENMLKSAINLPLILCVVALP